MALFHNNHTSPGPFRTIWVCVCFLNNQYTPLNGTCDLYIAYRSDRNGETLFLLSTHLEWHRRVFLSERLNYILKV